MEHTHLYSFFTQRNQTMEAAPSNMRLKLDWCQDPSIGAWIHWLASWCSSQWYRDARLWDPRWRVTTHPEANQGVISQCSYSRIFITKTSALSHFTCRSETEEAEDADEDRCTAESDIVPALTWDGIQGLYRIHRPREWDVYNLTTTFHPVSTFPEGTRFPKIPCRCMPVWRGKWWKLMNFPWTWNSVNPNLFHRVTPSLFQPKCMDLKKTWTSTWSKSTCSIINTVDGWNPAITSWGNGSWNPMIYKVLYIPRWWSPDFWTINSITSQASRKTPWDTTSCWRFCWG